MARRRGRRSSRRSSRTDWGSVILWGLGISAGLFVLTGAAGITLFQAASAPQPLPTLPNPQQLLTQMR
jgi:hypothetical protein